MAAYGISVESSKFSCLPCDDEAEVKKTKNRGKKKDNKESNSKKDEQQSKKKKEGKGSLQSMATLSNKKKKQSVPSTALSTSPTSNVQARHPDPDWDTWQERDTEVNDNEFERNLQQALLLSKLEEEQAQALRFLADGDASKVGASGEGLSGSSGATKKKKQKKSGSEVKAEKTVSLATFLNESSPPLDQEGVAEINSKPSSRLQSSEEQLPQNEETLLITPHFATLIPKPKTYEVDASGDTLDSVDDGAEGEFIRAEKSRAKDSNEVLKHKKEKEKEKVFFEKVHKDVGKIIRKEECTQFMKNNEHLISETVRSAQYLADLEEKDKEIENLNEDISRMKEEFAKVKKRNKQLAFIISQGEMQEKADLLTEIDDLKEVKDELTLQTAQLQQELEQERTKNHKLTKELHAIKGHKGGKQSSPSTGDE